MFNLLPTVRIKLLVLRLIDERKPAKTKVQLRYFDWECQDLVISKLSEFFFLILINLLEFGLLLFERYSTISEFLSD